MLLNNYQYNCNNTISSVSVAIIVSHYKSLQVTKLSLTQPLRKSFDNY